MPAFNKPLTLAALLALGLSAAVRADVVDLPDGSRYSGTLKDGRLHGKGRLVWPGGQVYEGEFAHGQRQGLGLSRTPSGQLYQGEFFRGQWHGKGRLESGDDYVYEGEFLQGHEHGLGRLKTKELQYQGQFAKGQIQGQGRLRLPGGQVYEGTFQDGQPHGKTRLTLPNKVVLEGDFDGLEPPGRGVLLLPPGLPFVRYEGQILALQPHGKGVMTLVNKAVMRGNFELGDPDGEMRIDYPDGSQYRGEVDEGRPDGKGRLQKTGGGVQDGYWRAGRYLGPQGDGTLPASAELFARNNAAALYNQQALLQAQIERLQPSDAASGPHMYALYVAGDGRQEVFRREVQFVGKLMSSRFGLQGRTITLVNSRSSVAQLPLATAHSIGQALQALAGKMDRQRDLLFVYLSSHGSRKHELMLQMPHMALPDLPAAQLAELLNASGIGKRIVVVSACYSGGFVPALQGPTSWVITASRADRASFGCADGNDFTYFGRALFEQALPQSHTLSEAFARARQLVRQWEKAGGPPPEATGPADAAAPVATPAAATPNAGQAPGASAPALAAAPAHAPPRDGSPQALAQRLLRRLGEDKTLSDPQSAVTPAFREEVDNWLRRHPPAQRAPATNATNAGGAG